jgi:CRISPR/Cas system-associated exonuclease Cas4 (RecB family)
LNLSSHFNQTLFIARSSESAELYLSNHTGAIKAITLGVLLSSEAFSSSIAMDAMIGKMLLQRVVKSLKLDHFDYLSTAESAIGELYNHILACKRNKIGFESFNYPSQKLIELSMILDTYETLKQSMGLKDNADVLIEAIEALKDSNYFNTYSKVVIETFEEEGIRFYANTLEKEALDIIRALPHAQIVDTELHSVNPISTYTPQQSRFDEAIFAIKAARKLMVEGVKDTDIAIVTGNLNHYRRILESHSYTYGMKIRFSSGALMLQSTLFQHYLSFNTFEDFNVSLAERLNTDLSNNSITMEEIEKIRHEFNQIKRLHLRVMQIQKEVQSLLSQKIDFKETIKALSEETYIPPMRECEGIWVSEPNQMTQRYFKHVIFIGTDLSQFPPRAKGNFLATQRQREELLGVDNTYLLSQYYFEQLRKTSMNLHVSTALFEGKKKLFISPIITNLPKISFDGYETVSVREVLRQHRRWKLDESSESFIEAMLSPELSPYDGAALSHSFESGVLSASSLNEYAKCPLRYLLGCQYNTEPLSVQRDDDELEASDIGKIFHSIAEKFANDVKAGNILLGIEVTHGVKETLANIAKNIHQAYIKKEIIDKGKTGNIFHEIVLLDLLKGLFEEHHERGLLIRFLDYIYSDGNLEYFERSEQRFMLDSEFSITRDKEAVMLKGFIDRIDLDRKDQRVAIIDYKTGKYSKDKENRLVEEMAAYKQFQLPLYLLYASQAYKDHTIDSFLVSFKDGKGVKPYAHMSTDETKGLLFDTDYAQGLKERIKGIKSGIENGKFAMTPSDENCEYCSFEKICHKDIFGHKGTMRMNEGEDNE